jgi:hypothetical protein
MFFLSPSSSRLSSSKNGVIKAGNTPLSSIDLDLASASSSLPHHIGNISCNTISYGLIFDVGILRYHQFILFKVRTK